MNVRCTLMVKRAGASRRGAAAVEFALILPLLLILVLGAVDLGRFTYQYIALTNAVRTGAGYGIMHPFTAATRGRWEAQIRQTMADDIADLTGTDPSDLSVTINTVSEAGGLWRLEISATLPFETVVGWPEIPTEINLARQLTMRSMR